MSAALATVLLLTEMLLAPLEAKELQRLLWVFFDCMVGEEHSGQGMTGEDDVSPWCLLPDFSALEAIASSLTSAFGDVFC